MHVRGAPERDDIALGDRTARVKGEAVKDDDIVPAGGVGVERGLTDGKSTWIFREETRRTCMLRPRTVLRV